jgi:hypothetical protein
MNAKLLFTVTLSLAVASSFALAEDGKPVSRADVVADYQREAAAGTLRKNDYDFDKRDIVAGSVRSRDDVVAEMTAARTGNTLLGPMRNRNYNPYGNELMRPSRVERAQVRADVLAAMRDGTLRRTDYDDLPIRGVRPRANPLEAPILAGGRAAAPVR